jgi:class 3 adenylate cyclase
VAKASAVWYTYVLPPKSMNPASLLQLPGHFNFLRRDSEELQRLLPDLHRALPTPQPIFLEDEGATPLQGFPILLSEGMTALATALRQYILCEETVQLAIQRRDTYDRKLYNAAWERYRLLLSRAVENATISNYGRLYPAVFWLHHSTDVARLLKETPKRLLREDLDIGRRLGDGMKYRILDRFLDRVLESTYDLVHRLAGATEEAEEELFPRLLTRMRDNVLIFTEDHISPDLAELGSYFSGYLKIDGREIRQRLDDLARWHTDVLASDNELRSIAAHLFHCDPQTDARDLLNRSGYLSFLSTRQAYNPVRLLPPILVQVWESLLVKLKEFEVFQALRRAMYRVEVLADGRVEAREPLAALAAPRGAIPLSPVTRPLDFMEPWVVDPRVERFGLIYDISEFSQTISYLQRTGTDRQDEAFRAMFRFQRRVNRLAGAHRAKLEKYLGDGAFYSSREALNLLICAIHLQRYYEQAVGDGFAFDRGLRIALNFGSYRLIPMGSGNRPENERYEFFGHGMVEMSRLVTGKATQEIDEVKTMLIAQGYPERTVHRFFEPLAEANVDVVDKSEESRRFYAYINRNGTLLNNGLVATGAYVARLDKELGATPLGRGSDGERSYIVFHVEDGVDRLPVGLRKLGAARLKGLERLPLYEIVDGSSFDLKPLVIPAGEGLAAAAERELTRPLTRQE